ncbi:MAG: hypothetical protein WBQ73_03790 [Candidatus Babeliales bacterium]
MLKRFIVIGENDKNFAKLFYSELVQIIGKEIPKFYRKVESVEKELELIPLCFFDYFIALFTGNLTFFYTLFGNVDEDEYDLDENLNSLLNVPNLATFLQQDLDENVNRLRNASNLTTFLQQDLYEVRHRVYAIKEGIIETRNKLCKFHPVIEKNVIAKDSFMNQKNIQELLLQYQSDNVSNQK